MAEINPQNNQVVAPVAVQSVPGSSPVPPAATAAVNNLVGMKAPTAPMQPPVAANPQMPKPQTPTNIPQSQAGVGQAQAVAGQVVASAAVSPSVSPTPVATATPKSAPAPAAQTSVQMPVFQASPSGGVVATLRPGQTSFEGQIRADSGRRSGQTDSNDGSALVGESGGLPAIQLQKSGNPDAFVLEEQPKPESKPEAPKSVRNFKVGAEQREKKPINWVLWIVILGLSLILAFIVYFYLGQKKAEEPAPEPVVEEPTVLNYWGLWEPTASFVQVLNDFEKENPGVSVIYQQQKETDGYLAELKKTLGSEIGPDVFRYHASWRGMLEDELSTLPEELMSTSEFERTFYPIASKQLKNKRGQVQGIPLMYDSLALIYNQEIFDDAGLEVPKNWSEFNQAAFELTLYGDDGNSIKRSGAAMGLADNVDFASDIVMLLALQNGMDPETYDEELLDLALDYYTSYYNDYARQTWDEGFDNSTLAFARGDVAMILGPSWLVHDIIKINPTLKIGVASVPQLTETAPVEWATYYAEGVNAKAPAARQLAAWRLLTYLSRPEVLEKLYSAQAEERSFGEIYPRPDMADKLAENAYVQPYLRRAEYAQNLPFNDRTYDAAVNDKARAIVLEAIREKTGTESGYQSGNITKNILDVLVEYGYAEPPSDE